jgi:aryl-alcohol dehydrogenase-like predicted oxidoreductase
MPYARTGRSGLKLPRISLGLWYNFGGLWEIGRRWCRPTNPR